MTKKQQPLRELGALAQLRASMDQAGSDSKPKDRPVAPPATDAVDPGPIPLANVEPAQPEPELSSEEKLAARRARDAQRKREKRAEEKARAEVGQAILDAGAAEMEATGADTVVINGKEVTEVDLSHLVEPTPEEPVSGEESLNDDDPAVEPQPVAAPAPAPSPALSKDEREKRGLIEQIVAYYPARIRAEESTKLADFSPRRLQELLDTFKRHLGEPDTLVGELNAIYLERMRDPSVIAAGKALNQKGFEYDKIISNIARVVGDDVLTNTLNGNDFRTAARDAVNNMAVLKRMIIGDLEPVLRRYLDLPGADSHPELPQGISQLMGILKHAAAHLDAAHSRDRANDTHKDELRRDIANLNRTVQTLQEGLSAANRRTAEQFAPSPRKEVFIYQRGTGRYLANHMMPEGRKPKRHRVAVLQFYWTSDVTQAIRFDTPERARRLVDLILTASTQLIRGTAPNVAGEAMETIGLAELAIRLPTE